MAKITPQRLYESAILSAAREFGRQIVRSFFRMFR